MKISFRYLMEVVPLLNSIALRYNPESDYWFREEDGELYCNICNLKIIIMDSDSLDIGSTKYSSVIEHGYNHLRARNLLPFL
jgi:hypothetical protein